MSETPARRKIFSDIVKNLDLYLSGAAFIFVSCVTFLLVITRYLYSLSLPALEEITMIVFVWFLYLSMIFCLRKNLHIRVEIIDTIVSARIKNYIEITADILLIIFTFVMFYYGSLLVDFNMTRSGGKTPMLDIPYYAVYIVLPLSFGLFTFFLATRIIRKIKILLSKNHIK